MNQKLSITRFSAPENPKTEADYRNITREQVSKTKPLPRIPFVILTSPDRAKARQPIFSDEAIEIIAKLDSALNNKLAALIPGGRQIIVAGAGPDIHVDKPEALIAPVVEMIKEVREKKDKESTRRGRPLPR
jgi:hypothetical protein